MLSIEDLATFRAAQEATMTTDCMVIAPGTPTPDGLGGMSPGAATETETTCRLAPTAGQELEIATQLQAVETVTITVPYGTDIEAGYRIEIGSEAYQVVAMLVHGNLATAIRVLATVNA